MCVFDSSNKRSRLLNDNYEIKILLILRGYSYGYK